MFRIYNRQLILLAEFEDCTEDFANGWRMANTIGYDDVMNRLKWFNITPDITAQEMRELEDRIYKLFRVKEGFTLVDQNILRRMKILV